MKKYLYNKDELEITIKESIKILKISKNKFKSICKILNIKPKSKGIYTKKSINKIYNSSIYKELKLIEKQENKRIKYLNLNRIDLAEKLPIIDHNYDNILIKKFNKFRDSLINLGESITAINIYLSCNDENSDDTNSNNSDDLYDTNNCSNNSSIKGDANCSTNDTIKGDNNCSNTTTIKDIKEESIKENIKEENIKEENNITIKENIEDDTNITIEEENIEEENNITIKENIKEEKVTEELEIFNKMKINKIKRIKELINKFYNLIIKYSLCENLTITRRGLIVGLKIINIEIIFLVIPNNKIIVKEMEDTIQYHIKHSERTIEKLEELLNYNSKESINTNYNSKETIIVDTNTSNSIDNSKDNSKESSKESSSSIDTSKDNSNDTNTSKEITIVDTNPTKDTSKDNSSSIDTNTTTIVDDTSKESKESKESNDNNNNDTSNEKNKILNGWKIQLKCKFKRELKMIIKIMGGKIDMNSKICIIEKVNDYKDGIIYLYPQFLIDSFNCKKLLKISDYLVGNDKPKHISSRIKKEIFINEDEFHFISESKKKKIRKLIDEDEFIS